MSKKIIFLIAVVLAPLAAQAQLSCTTFVQEPIPPAVTQITVQCNDPNPSLQSQWDVGEVRLNKAYSSYTVIDDHGSSFIINDVTSGFIFVGGATIQVQRFIDEGAGAVQSQGTTSNPFDTVHLTGFFDDTGCFGNCGFSFQISFR